MNKATETTQQGTRLATTFADLRQAQQKALIPFITTGDPHGVSTADIMHALVVGGANVIELGIPFSDPAADGETIQHASERAIAHGVGYRQTFAAVKAFRETDDKTPVVLMGYLNPAEVHDGGFEGFANAVADCGADAVILVDLSYESGVAYRKALRKAGVDLVNLIAPTTSKTRLGRILKNAGGFVYYVSMRGITGSGSGKGGGLDLSEIDAATARIREKSALPVCVGFGINDGDTAKSVSAFADGVVVGSALVKQLDRAAQSTTDADPATHVTTTATAFMNALRRALDGVQD